MSAPIDPIGALVGARIRNRREAAGMTQAQVADASGIQRPIVARIERGTHAPSLYTVMRIASALGARPSTLLEVLDAGCDEPNPNALTPAQEACLADQ